jgi:exodeoxyribonuclease-5
VLRDSLDCQGIVIDEASMVNEEIYSDLKYFNIPLIFIGDHGQLPPVGGKDFNLMGNPDYRLEEIHRNAGDIAHFANHIRQGLNPHDFPKSKQIEFVYQLSDDVLIKADQVICAYNATRVKLNKQIRAKLGYKDFLVNGDKVMCLRNNRKVGIFNGMQGKVSNYHIEKGRVYIDFEANGFFPKLEIDPIAFHSEKPTFDRDPDSPHPFEYAYAITAHKSQGDQFDSVCVLEQKCNNWDHNRWFYTAVSRAKSKLIIIPADKPKAKVDLTDPTLKEIFGL